MRKMTLGRTGYEVTQLGYGALEVRGTSSDDERGRVPNEERANQILNAVLDSGINFIDTAWCYGRSEEMMGKFIGNRRDDYLLAAKTGHGRCSADNFASYKRKDMLGVPGGEPSQPGHRPSGHCAASQPHGGGRGGDWGLRDAAGDQEDAG